MRLLLAALASAAFVLAMPAVAQDATLASAVRACLDATSGAGVDDARLRSSGWDAYDMTVGSDDMPLRLYGRGRGPMLMAGVGGDSKESGCHILQPLSGTTSFAAATDQLSAELRSAPTERKSAEAIWVFGTRAVMLEATTKNSKPAVHVTVVNIAEGTK